MDRRRVWALTGATVALVTAGGVTVAVRASDQRPASVAASPSAVRVVLPGKPGESAAVSDSDHVRAPDGSPYNSIDVTYAQMMIAHHRQAVQMAKLAPERAGSAQLRSLAERIVAGQGPEIAVLQAWLSERGQPENDPDHDHSGMPGMQSAAALAELTSARGADFDHRFVTMMTEHHEGAQQMAADLLRGGSDERLNELANETAVEQMSEIHRMADLGL
ncbi:DUF305 domain-containing protein [Actinoplanes sp. NPDC051851]|uniref:DUF305 domain-containing protein n=1 Tax=Actinoplanes sp. NPDC051851 TaxID=3154753 RepID=UPI0034349469